MLLFIAFLVGTLLHLATIAATARAFGVGIRTVSLGFGPRVVGIGSLRICALPAGGYVRLVDSREGPLGPGEKARAFDGKSPLAQIVVSLSGCGALILAAVVLAGPGAWRAAAAAPLQFILGAASPFGEAQDLLRGMWTFSASASTASVFGIVAAKMAGINLLPLPALNGGAAVAVLARATGLHKVWSPASTQALLLLLVAALGSWLVAIVVHAVKA